MKKITANIVALFAITGLVLAIYAKDNMPATSELLISSIECLTQSESSGSSCKWKVIDCPGWFTGDYEACLDNGDGKSCSCGATTRDC